MKEDPPLIKNDFVPSYFVKSLSSFDTTSKQGQRKAWRIPSPKYLTRCP
jgi:hypothetical protein